jgi:pimeloyl-ACP methyl ester carboxylesterase
MPRATVPANVGTIEIEYETFGSTSDPTLLLVMGFTAQMIAWSDDFCRALADLGLHVVRFDNRDCGLSSKLDGVMVDPGPVMAAVFANEPAPPVPYTLSDMARDAIGLLDHLAVDSAHIVGASMGGMIVQHMAIEHPSRVRSLTSIMSMTGEPEYGSPTPEAAEALLAPPETERQAYIDASPKFGVSGAGPRTAWLRSTRITSAPMSDSIIAANGPGPIPAISMTR